MAAASRLIVLLLAACGAVQAQTWDFAVALDGKPIGSHRFVVSGAEATREVHSQARFDVKLLGLTLFRYRHEAHERWQGDCLAQLKSSTDDDGKPVKADVKREPGDGCLMGFAYWHPQLHTQTRLLNPQTGLVEDARFERMPDAALAVNGREVPATRWRLTATSTTGKQNLTLWLRKTDGAWIGLDARVKGDRLLTYRLN
ncbi:DUF6134 family protein [Roseateles asaccharophilus]|uniref:DUF3108 domain-containing protein n=1 Tax=Roseateles asaccharophilus TaxID=582607 RepID=A0ABU2A4Q3_9BURK|nr:DUF6134 family protein [Roseateles asaccharophilus]MDR7332131.1 hypothetical protein [Roseateles asaccharophilus]